MRERHEDQHLTGGFLNDFQHGVDAVADVELQHLTSVRVDRASANLEQLVDACSGVDRADLFAPSFDQHLALKLLVILHLLRGERRFALGVGHFRQVQAILLLEPDGWLEYAMHNILRLGLGNPFELGHLHHYLVAILTVELGAVGSTSQLSEAISVER